MKLNLFNKFIVAFISIGLVPVLFISSYSAWLFQRETRQMLEDNYRATAFYAARNLDSLIERYNAITKLLYSYSAKNSGIIRSMDGLGLAEILKSPVEDEAARVKRYNDIISFLYLVQSTDFYITNVMFMDKSSGLNTEEGTIYAFGRSSISIINRERLLSITGSRSEKANQLIVIPTHQDDYLIKRPVDVFTMGRNYIDLSYPLGADLVLGTLYINVEIKAIEDIFSHLGLYRHNGILILDAEDNVIYNNGVTPKNYFEITEPCETGDWRVIINIDYRRATQNIINLVWLIYIIVIMVLLILLALAVIYSNVFSRPIKALLRGMKQVEEGNFNIQLNIKGQDEIKLLAEGFMQMTTKLENHIQTSILSKLRLKEAELSALRARIKPHFIYNSLEIIRMNAIAHDDESTADLSFHLAEFMHTLIESGNIEVSLRQELNSLRNYLAFIDIRYERRIVWEIIADDNISEAKVLSLMIQPVVENAIIHGINPLGEGHISIKIKREDKNLAIIIADDGIGMDEEIKQKIIAHLHSASPDTEDWQKGASIGLKNVHDRLRYTYGNSYGVSIDSSPDKGTTITMLLPLRFSDEGNRDV